MEYDLYQWTGNGSGQAPDLSSRSTAMVIRRSGEVQINGASRQVGRGDILIIPPPDRSADHPILDPWTVAAAVLILLATCRIFL